MKILAGRSFLAKFAIKEGHKMEDRAITTGLGPEYSETPQS